MPKINKNIRGESLLELIIAFVIFAISITIAGMILGSALRNMQNAKNRSVAVNIAREGLEAVRNIRDTNWLKYHSNRRGCWNQLPTLNNNAPCDITKYIKSGQYIIYKQGIAPDSGGKPTYRWRLGELKWSGLQEFSSANIPTCEQANIDKFYHNTTETITYKCIGSNPPEWKKLATLSLTDIDIIMVDTDKDDKYDNDPDLYNHMDLGPNDGSPLGKSIKETVFTRVITIGYINNNGATGPAIDPDSDPNVNRMLVTSTVSWMSGGHKFKVELTTHLTDYLGREKIKDN